MFVSRNLGNDLEVYWLLISTKKRRNDQTLQWWYRGQDISVWQALRPDKNLKRFKDYKFGPNDKCTTILDIYMYRKRRAERKEVFLTIIYEFADISRAHHAAI